MSAVRQLRDAAPAESTPAQAALDAHRERIADLNAEFNDAAKRVAELEHFLRDAAAAAEAVRQCRENRGRAAGALIAGRQPVKLPELDAALRNAESRAAAANAIVTDNDGENSIRAGLDDLAEKQHAITAQIAKLRGNEPALLHGVALDRAEALAPHFKATLTAFVEALVEVAAHCDYADSIAQTIPGTPQCGSGNLRRFEVGLPLLNAFQMESFDIAAMIRTQLAAIKRE